MPTVQYSTRTVIKMNHPSCAMALQLRLYLHQYRDVGSGAPSARRKVTTYRRKDRSNLLSVVRAVSIVLL
jgi:hypothetical protein